MTDAPEPLVLRLGAPAHGGHVVARTDEGRVVFVRHGLPGELVRVRLSDHEPDASFWRGDAVEVLEAASGRRAEHVWPEADAVLAAAAGRAPLGGAEFGHAELETQRGMKTAVVAEQLSHLAGVEWDGAVRPVAGETPDGTGWRTRLHLDVGADGTAGMYPHRSGELSTLGDMPLATDAIRALAPWSRRYRGAERVDVAAPEGGTPLVHVNVRPDASDDDVAALRAELTEWGAEHGLGVTAHIPGRRETQVWTGAGELRETLALPGQDEFSWRVSPTGFWQVHRRAPETLVSAVLDAAQFAPGDAVWDLYSGAGLFTAVAARAVGEKGSVLAVEGSPVTSADAAHNLADAPHVRTVRGDVARVLTGRAPRGGQRRGRSRAAASSRARNGQWGPRPGRPDVVVLDPPRAGAAKDVLGAVDHADPRRIVYVACDPAALGRDLGRLRRRGWRVDGVEAFDLYPNTHHVEAVAALSRDR
ncbi:SAM-dependent methyltransferase [Kocuria varians]|uniref:SAM-dependent methyltransferase n=1 Tax=Kocuria varians TaxID=1272 RepID=A0A4Y4D5A9_KOCVA|nr:TRAM domain-containing protein [Kocuria varians]GEC98477.1 SAM-dependent methyltransferase [Kocuria varians]